MDARILFYKVNINSMFVFTVIIKNDETAKMLNCLLINTRQFPLKLLTAYIEIYVLRRREAIA